MAEADTIFQYLIPSDDKKAVLESLHKSLF